MIALRVLSGAFLIGALATLVLDVMQSLKTPSGLVITTLGDLWTRIQPASLDGIQEALRAPISPLVWGPSAATLLRMPAWWLVFGLIGSLLYWASFRHRSNASVTAKSSKVVTWTPQLKSPLPGASPRSELKEALISCRGAFLGIGLFSGMINILMLTGSFFMLEIYDRVLPSRSVPTLVGLSLLAGGLFAAQGILDLIRGRLQVRIGASLDEALSAEGLQRDRPPAAQDGQSQRR